jgi:hypothetical protein
MGINVREGDFSSKKSYGMNIALYFFTFAFSAQGQI